MARKPARAKKAKLHVPKYTEEEVCTALAPFLAMNPYSVIGRFTLAGKGEWHQIETPWGDPTLSIILGDDLEAEAESLNHLYLPKALTALWHRDTRDIEVIWTAYPLSEIDKEIGDRSFSFIYDEYAYQCEFTRSSERLLELARGVVTKSNPTSTYFRNMQSFRNYVLGETDQDRERLGVDEPRSFFIRDVSLPETEALELIRHINFYMSYLDAETPTVLIHHESGENYSDRSRYVRGEFSREIRARMLDENLLSFWQAARLSDNNILRFILYYRVLEYAAYHYIDLAVREKLKAIIADPVVCSNIGGAVDRVLDIVDAKKTDEVPRFNSLLTSQINPEVVWRELEKNREAFSAKTKFDGGYTLDVEVLGKADTLDTFRYGGMLKFANAIRGIRNVLAHGKDQTTGKVITPSERNLNQLKPWVNAIAAAAGEVVLYEAIS